MPSLTIDLYTEISCPWCYIGIHRLDKVLANSFSNLTVDVIHHPVILSPDCPPGGARIADLLLAKMGVSDPSALWERPHAEARASGIELDLAHQPFAYPTHPGHTLIRHARTRGTQRALAKAISHAYFIDAANTSDANVLADMAQGHGFERDEARSLVLDPAERAETERLAAQSRESGVKSVPHYVFGGQIAINGGRSEEELAAAISQALATAEAPSR